MNDDKFRKDNIASNYAHNERRRTKPALRDPRSTRSLLKLINKDKIDAQLIDLSDN